MLYFDQLDEEAKMGTIRQQIWALLHFPLHCAIVLTVEGNTSLIPWNSAVQGLKLVWSLRPGPDDAPSTSFASNSAFVSYLNDSMWEISNHFKAYKLADEYDWTTNLTSINDIAQNVTFNSGDYFSQTSPIIDGMFDYTENFVFKAHDATMSKMLKATSSKATTAHDSLDSIYEIYDIITLYFYIAAGATLLLLSAMYWFGKPHHTRSEAGGPIVRMIVGSLLIASGCLAVFVDKGTTGYKFQESSLLIPVVALAYLVVIAFDTVFTFFSEHPETGAIIFHRGAAGRGRGHAPRHSTTSSTAAPYSTSRGSGFAKDPDAASLYSDQARMIPLDTMPTTTGAHTSYDPAGDYSYNGNRSGAAEAGAASSGLETPDFAKTALSSSTSLSAAQESRMSRFKSLKAPAYSSLNEDDDLYGDHFSGDDYDDYDTGRLGRYGRSKESL